MVGPVILVLVYLGPLYPQVYSPFPSSALPHVEGDLIDPVNCIFWVYRLAGSGGASGGTSVRVESGREGETLYSKVMSQTASIFLSSNSCIFQMTCAHECFLFPFSSQAIWSSFMLSLISAYLTVLWLDLCSSSTSLTNSIYYKC